MRYVTVKHALDRAVAVAALIALAPVMATLAAVVRLDSPGPIIFRQRRIGQDGQSFTILKFRTMYTDAPVAPRSTVDEPAAKGGG